MPDEPVREGDDEPIPDARANAIDRRALMKIGLAGGALVAIPALIARATSAGNHSPFDTPFAAANASGTHGDHRPSTRAPRNPRTPPPARIVARTQWRADERIRSHRIAFDRTVEKIIVHHTGTNSVEPDWPGEVRAIYQASIARGYRDMPYHWLVDPDGVVYEGRWARRVPAGVTPNGEDARGRSVRGGHTLGHNPRTIGVALLGTFDHHRPTTAAFDALVALIAWKCDRWRIDPHAATPYEMKDGRHQVIPNLCPHRRVRPTDCPGREVVDLLPELRLATARRIDAFT
jgi:hypothetical protein